MRKDLAEILCCPDDKTPLTLTASKEDDHGNVEEGLLHCKDCGFDFPIEGGIPNLLPKAYHVDQVKKPSAKGAGKGGKKATRQGSKAKSS